MIDFNVANTIKYLIL